MYVCPLLASFESYVVFDYRNLHIADSWKKKECKIILTSHSMDCSYCFFACVV